jgi:hypothetical protein
MLPRSREFEDRREKSQERKGSETYANWSKEPGAGWSNGAVRSSTAEVAEVAGGDKFIAAGISLA